MATGLEGFLSGPPVGLGAYFAGQDRQLAQQVQAQQMQSHQIDQQIKAMTLQQALQGQSRLEQMRAELNAAGPNATAQQLHAIAIKYATNPADIIRARLEAEKGQIVPPGSSVLGAGGNVIFRAPERQQPFSLAPGVSRYDANGNVVATAPEKPQPFSLAPGARRYDQQGNVIAEAPAAQTGFSLAPGGTRYDAQGNPVATAPNRDVQPHYVQGVGPDGNITAVGIQGGRVTSSVPTGLKPTGENTQIRVQTGQARRALQQSINPLVGVLNAAQSYEDIRASGGDTSQANQALAGQLVQMERSGSIRALPTAELERILGSTGLGGSVGERITNAVSQLASGVRTAETDAKLNAVANALSDAASKRIGQELQNARSALPKDVKPEDVTGGIPRIYGRFVITPEGTRFPFKNAQEAQAGLAKMIRAANEQQQP